LAWLAGSCIVLLGAGEIVARLILGLGTPVLYVAHPLIEYMMRPNQDVRRFGKHVLVNAYGMRSEQFPAHKTDARELRVLVMGDSVVNGGSLTDQSLLATSLLHEELARSTGRRVVVGNVSAGSWGPQNLLAWSKVYGFFDADYVVVVLSSHDASDVPTFAPLDPLQQPTSNPISALLEGATRYLPRYLPSYLQRTPVPDSTAPQGDADFQPARPEALAAARELLRAARSAGSCVAMVQHLTQNEQSGAGRGHDALEAIADELDIFHVDDAEAVKTAAAQQPYRDNIHFSDAGQAVLAKVLLEAIGRCT